MGIAPSSIVASGTDMAVMGSVENTWSNPRGRLFADAEASAPDALREGPPAPTPMVHCGVGTSESDVEMRRPMRESVDVSRRRLSPAESERASCGKCGGGTSVGREMGEMRKWQQWWRDGKR
jgi:hypothetical protein